MPQGRIDCAARPQEDRAPLPEVDGETIWRTGRHPVQMSTGALPLCNIRRQWRCQGIGLKGSQTTMLASLFVEKCRPVRRPIGFL
jgi:hypothetical protein